MNISELLIEIGDDTFEAQVRQNPLPVLALFHAPDCHACKPLEADLTALAPRCNHRAVLAKIDAVRFPELARRFGVITVPTVILFRQGTPTYQFIGVPPRQELIALIEALPPAPAPETLAGLKQMAEREAQLLRLGYDNPAAMAFVLSEARPIGGATLEIGTGKGRFLVELARIAESVVTVDIDPQEQEIARLNARSAGVEHIIQFVTQDAARLPWPNHTFDAVATMNAIHHIKDFPKALDEMLRVVKPTGKLVLSDFNARGFEIIAQAHQEDGQTHPREIYRFCDLQQLMRERGWQTRLRQGCDQEVLVATKDACE